MGAFRSKLEEDDDDDYFNDDVPILKSTLYRSCVEHINIYIHTHTPATGKGPQACSFPHGGQSETFSFRKDPYLEKRCRVQFETFQYNFVLW